MSTPKAEVYSPEVYDGYLNMRGGIPRFDDNLLIFTTVKIYAVDIEGRSMSKASNNPGFDTRKNKYDVKYDKTIKNQKIY